MPGQLYNLDSKYGSAEDLKKLNKALTEAGMCPLADIVINHRLHSACVADGDVMYARHKQGTCQTAAGSTCAGHVGVCSSATGNVMHGHCILLGLAPGLRMQLLVFNNTGDGMLSVCTAYILQ